MVYKRFIAAIISILSINNVSALIVRQIEQGPFVLTIDETNNQNGGLNYLFSMQYNGTDPGANAFEIHAMTQNPVVRQVDLSDLGLHTIFDFVVFVDPGALNNDTHVTSIPPYVFGLGTSTYENEYGIHAVFAFEDSFTQLHLFQIVVPNGGVINCDGSSTSEPISWEVQLASDSDFEIMQGVLGVPEPTSLVIFGFAGAMLIRRPRYIS